MKLTRLKSPIHRIIVATTALFVVAVAMAAASTRPVRAHILVKDPAGAAGAIVHIMPDDDPIAGEPASFFFDIQGGTFSTHEHLYALVITDQSGAETVIPVATTATTASATYTFPQQGVYTVVLSAASVAPATGHTHYFSFEQRVTRGAAYGIIKPSNNSTAELLLIASICALLLLLIITYNRRTKITSYSKW